MRSKLFKFLRKLAKVKEAEIPPGWLKVIGIGLFPVEYYYRNHGIVRYDPVRNIITIGGKEFTPEVFQAFKDLSNEGKLVRLKDLKGTVTIEFIQEPVKNN